MKKPEEIKRGLECCARGGIACCECPYVERQEDDISSDCVESLRMDSLDIIRRLEAKMPKWISVKDRLPEDVKDKEGYFINYLVYSPEYGSVDIANYIQEADMWVCLGVPVNVTHWMPLPEPPEEVNQ